MSSEECKTNDIDDIMKEADDLLDASDDNLSNKSDAALDSIVTGDTTNLADEDDDLEAGDEIDMFEAVRQRAQQMEEEVAKLSAVLYTGSQPDDEQMDSSSATTAKTLSDAERRELDSRSVFVGNVDYEVSTEQLIEHFRGCGTIVRATIKRTRDGKPKGFAYVELDDATDAAELMMQMDGSELNGRRIKVLPKRTNIAGMRPQLIYKSRGRGRGRGGRGSGRGWNRGGGAAYYQNYYNQPY